MRYELRTTLSMPGGSPLVLEDIRRADRLLRDAAARFEAAGQPLDAERCRR